MVEHKISWSFGTQRFVALLLASLTLGHITADKKIRYTSPKFAYGKLHISPDEIDVLW